MIYSILEHMLLYSNHNIPSHYLMCHTPWSLQKALHARQA